MMIPGTEWSLQETFGGNARLIANLNKVPMSKLAPAPEDVFNALKLTPPQKTKVIIIGQD